MFSKCLLILKQILEPYISSDIVFVLKYQEILKKFDLETSFYDTFNQSLMYCIAVIAIGTFKTYYKSTFSVY